MRSLATLVLAPCFLIAAPAAAEITMQGRLEPLSLAGLVQSAAGDNGFAVGIRSDRLVLRGALGLQMVRASSWGNGEWGDNSYEVDERYSALVLTPGVQLQYYLAEPKAGQVAPFVAARLAKAFVVTDETTAWRDCTGDVCVQGPEEDEDNELSDEREAMQRSLLSPWIGAIGAGMEVFPMDAVSIGMEIGLRLLYTSGSLDWSEQDRSEQAKSRLLGMHLFYGVFTLNYFW